MKNTIFLLSFLLLSAAASAQVINYQGQPYSRTATRGIYGALGGFFSPPSDTLDHDVPEGLVRTSHDFRQWIFTGVRWLPLSGEASVPGSGLDSGQVLEFITWSNVSGKPSAFPPSGHTHIKADVTGLSGTLDSLAYKTTVQDTAAALRTTINTKLNVIDTAAMLSAYGNRINLKLNSGDTGSMLAPYSSRISAKIGFADTAAMLLPYAKKMAPAFSGLITGDSITAMQYGSLLQILTDGSTVNWDARLGAQAVLTLTGTGRAVTISNPVIGAFYQLILVQGSGGNKSVATWPAGTKWIAPGTAPVLSSTAGDIDVASFWYIGSGVYLANFGSYK